MGYCDYPENYTVSRQDCPSGHWKVHSNNFDNVGNALLTLFVVGSLEGWPNILYSAMDGDESGPKLNQQPYIAFYFIVFILIGSFFFLNLFIGAICYHFDKSQKREKQATYLFLNEDQIRWI